MIEESEATANVGKLLDTEVNDIWDIFFPYMKDSKKEELRTDESGEQKKPQKHWRFLTM